MKFERKAHIPKTEILGCDSAGSQAVHVVQEVKLLMPKAEYDSFDTAIQELVVSGIQRY